MKVIVARKKNCNKMAVIQVKCKVMNRMLIQAIKLLKNKIIQAAIK